jgi:molybdopterin-containing oxidoreductase family iron-sulfur binding subunit
MSNSRQYWNSLEQYNNTPEFVEKAQAEFQSPIPTEEFLGDDKLSETTTSRRDFLKFVGFSVAAAAAAACETPVVKSIPYVVRPEEVVPGVANYYASTYFDGFDFAGVLVKTREGRPIHIEGNKLSSVSKGGVNARVNSSVLSLYDSSRAMQPTVNGEVSDWSSVDKKVGGAIKDAAARGGKIRLLTNTIISPSTNALIGEMATALGEGVDFKHVMYDAASADGIRKANMESFGMEVVPNYNFNEAKTIVSFGADFLSTWLNSIEYASDYASRRKPEGDWMSKHYQFEGNLSLTGSNADVRGAIRPAETGAVLLALYNELAKKAGAMTVASKAFEDDNDVASKVKSAAKDLWNAKGHGLVVAGSNDKNIQLIVNAINNMLGAYGTTIDLTNPLKTRQGSDAEFAALAKELNSGGVDVLIINGVNPVYSAPAATNFAAGLAKAGTSVYIGDRADETGSLCTVLAAESHFLESWNDFNARGNEYSIAQPTITALFDTRQMQDCLLAWGDMNITYYDYMRKQWEGSLFAGQTKYGNFEAFWNSAVHDGVYNGTTASEASEVTFNADVASVASVVAKGSNSNGWDVEFYLETAMGVGNQGNNPWLQELPHPVTKVTWDNYITMNPMDMQDEAGNPIYNISIAEQTPATVAKLTLGGESIELPVVPLPGQKRGTVSVALGYGRTKAGKVVEQGDTIFGETKTVGANAFPMVAVNGTMQYVATGATIEPTGATYPLGWTQTHHTMMGRKIVNETSLKTFKESGKDKWNPDHVLQDAYGNAKHINKLDLWNAHDIALGHRWGMSIDLNACIGCGACVTACHSENNVPIVGKDEVRRTRTMSWLRIDRYFSSDMTKTKGKEEGLGAIETYGKMEIPSAYPEVVYQPVMCQHCNHAPCETVCPVAATTHSNEGLNQMTYNRCIGTRYCANNCPYKVRRFNWFNYIGDAKFSGINPSQDDLGRMVLNPDVTVRARGVMEKCSFCVQRIQAGKLAAKKAGRPVEDGEVTSACASACPTHAINFGDLNDENTLVAKAAKQDRAYNLIEEVGTQPNVWYQTKVRNLDEDRVLEVHAKHAGGHGHGDEHAHGDDAHGEHETHEEEHAH